MFGLNNIRRNTSIKTRLSGLMFLIISLIAVLSYFSISGIIKINKTGNAINKNYLSSNHDLFSLTENLYSIVIEGKNHILAIDPEGKAKAEELINQYINFVDDNLERYSLNLYDRQTINLYNKFLDEYEVYKRINKEILTLSEENKDYLALELSATSELSSFRKLKQLIQQMMAGNMNNANLSIETAEALKSQTISRIYILILIIIILSFFIGIVVIYDIADSIDQLKNNLSVLGKGEIPENRVKESKDEIGEMAIVCNNLSQNLSYLGNFANELGQGNYATSFTPLGKTDILGNKLLHLRDSLKAAKEEEERRRIEDEQRNWASKGLAQFAEILRQSSEEIHILGESIISNIVKYVGAIQGGIFSYNNSSEDDIHLELLAAYAYNRKKHLQKKIKLGDGLVGTCAIEKATIYIDELPEKYLEITSGLGHSQPRSLLIVPLKIEETILGVIEIASLEEIKEFQITFVERLAESIAVSLSTARINAKTIQLFEESKRQSLELAKQEDEMRKNLEEMRMAQDDAVKREVEMRGIMTAVDNTLIKCEYDTSGTLLGANSKYLHLMEYRLDELKGKNVRMFVPEEKIDKFSQYWQNLCKGIPHQGIISRKTRSNEIRWLLMSYTPVKDKDGNVFKILFLANDISEYIEKQERAREIAEDLKIEQKKLKKNYENNIKNLNQNIEQLANVKFTYENEFNHMYKSWSNHLYKIEAMKRSTNKQDEKIKQTDDKLLETIELNKKLKEEIEFIKQQKENKQTDNDPEIDRLYDKWLNSLDT